ncbi:LuxR family transcriptional regulator/LuxR family transcriptional regulator, quorum-sensing system regulator CciR [Monaibacterium marinum]|uniref:LuxR family transcriptional regulator/LuxR family transcriptional regulator, quorum-sensing system regulator CciR n=1 Tax=Pontivivens marinum TaxID=1690039 RepID=A0A2C9CNE2_9RHOB|nr:LuxR family transcriptional regulator [Monaibacterium marinum]SOH92728.1 LuxR family transcriptional regulator/LuxR family transcriptional regulator, quorum-sensing system regulator CciR [Monaibacterium marinum]
MIGTDLSIFIEQCASIHKPVDLWQLVLEFSQRSDVCSLNYQHFSTFGGAHVQIMTYGYPEGWAKEYIENARHRDDPIPELAAQLDKPFLWSQVGSLTSITAEQQSYLEELRRWHVGDGLAIQVYGPGLRNGYIGLGFADDAAQIDSRIILGLQLAAQTAHQRYCEMSLNHRRPRYDLSKREREVLAWIARGKSNAMISDILNISPHTVDTHLRRVYDKLGVTDRTSAAIIGLGSNVIQLDTQVVPLRQSRY